MINHVGMVKQISYFQILDKTLADKSILTEETRTVFHNQAAAVLIFPSVGSITCRIEMWVDGTSFIA